MTWSRVSVVACIALVSCGPSFVSRPTVVAFDPQGSQFWDLPVPCALRPDAPKAFAFRRWPADRSSKASEWLAAADATLQGRWGVSAGVFFPVSGPVDAASLPNDAAASLDPNASVFMIDVDPASPERGRRFPLSVQPQPANDTFSPPNLLAVLPTLGLTRRPSTEYAVVITDRVKDASGVALGRARAFHDAWEAASGATPAATALFAHLKQQLASEHVSLSAVVGATVFVTRNAAETALNLGAWARTQPAPERLSSWTLLDGYPDYELISTRVALPQFQTGAPPYLEAGEGLLAFDESGAPVLHGTQPVRVSLAVPRTSAPDGGYPLVLYVHGTGGDYRQVADRGPVAEVATTPPPTPTRGTGPAAWLARRGIASMGYDLPLHGDRSVPAETTGALFTNLQGELGVAINNRLVASTELALLTTFARGVGLSASEAVAAGLHRSSGEGVALNPARLSTLGQSLGSHVALPWFASDPRVRGAVIGGAGGGLVEFILGDARTTAEILAGVPLDTFHRGHPLLHLLQSLAETADPLAFASTVKGATREGKDLLMVSGLVDARNSVESQAAMAAALGLSFAGPVLDATVTNRVRLAGGDALPTPASGNLGSHSAYVTQFSAMNNQGHHVLSNHGPARHQAACFLLDVGTGAAPIVNAAASDDAAPCVTTQK